MVERVKVEDDAEEEGNATMAATKREDTVKSKKQKGKEEEEEEEEEEEAMIWDEEEMMFDGHGRRKIDADEEYDEDWVDRKKYFPVDLALGRKKSDDDDDDDDSIEGEKSAKKRGKKRSPARTLEELRQSDGKKFIALQLPPELPLTNNDSTTTKRGNKNKVNLLEVSDLRAGQLGEIEIYADGSAKLVIGRCKFDLENGATYQHHEQFAVIDERCKKFAVMGDIIGRLVATPDVEQLLDECLKEERS